MIFANFLPIFSLILLHAVDLHYCMPNVQDALELCQFVKDHALSAADAGRRDAFAAPGKMITRWIKDIPGSSREEVTLKFCLVHLRNLIRNGEISLKLEPENQTQLEQLERFLLRGRPLLRSIYIGYNGLKFSGQFYDSVIQALSSPNEERTVLDMSFYPLPTAWPTALAPFPWSTTTQIGHARLQVLQHARPDLASEGFTNVCAYHFDTQHWSAILVLAKVGSPENQPKFEKFELASKEGDFSEGLSQEHSMPMMN